MSLTGRRARSDRGVGAVLLSHPLYSSDLNPIGQLFAKPKALLLKATERPSGHCGPRLLDDLSADECSRYLGRAGYGSIKVENAQRTENLTDAFMNHLRKCLS
jgi:hypothetical protein